MKKIAIFIAVTLFVVSAFAGTGITGFLPQKTGYKKNFTPDQIADYAFDGAKPNIVPSNKFWSTNYADYAAELKNQIMAWMAAESGNADITEDEAEEMFRNMPTRKTVGKVKATGLSINQGNGEILGLAEPIERDPYVTIDGKGEYEIYGETGSMSCVCANTHIGIEASQDEWENEATSTTTKKSNSYKIPSGTNLTINITNTANGGAGGTATATATNTPTKSAGNWDGNTDPGPIRPNKPAYYCPYCGYSDCDGSCRQTTTVNNNRNNGCNDCGNSTKTLVVQQKTTPGQKLYRFGTWLNGAAQGAGSLMFGTAALQGKLGTRIINNINNFIPGSTDDDTGDGGNLPDDDTGDGGELPGDGGNLPGGFQRTSNQGFRLK